MLAVSEYSTMFPSLSFFAVLAQAESITAAIKTVVKNLDLLCTFPSFQLNLMNDGALK
jgi:hypothetical protein